jgi:hypothetical protein
VEVKEATVAAGAKANHLSYIGDGSIGAEANVGAGTITCNYDGIAKHRTEIGKAAFIGSNSALVARVKIGEGAYAEFRLGDHPRRAGRCAGHRPRPTDSEGRLGRTPACAQGGDEEKIAAFKQTRRRPVVKSRDERIHGSVRCR